MRIAFIAVLLTLSSVGNVAQNSPLNADGRMWETFGNSGSQGTSIKAAYVHGVIEGLRAGAARGYVRGRMDAYGDVGNYVKQCTDKGGPCADAGALKTVGALLEPGKGWSEGMDKLDLEVSRPPHASILEIVGQMDKFYSDYKNTPVCMIAAVQESIQSLKGKASSQQGLELMREQGCNH